MLETVLVTLVMLLKEFIKLGPITDGWIGLQVESSETGVEVDDKSDWFASKEMVVWTTNKGAVVETEDKASWLTGLDTVFIKFEWVLIMIEAPETLFSLFKDDVVDQTILVKLLLPTTDEENLFIVDAHWIWLHTNEDDDVVKIPIAGQTDVLDFWIDELVIGVEVTDEVIKRTLAEAGVPKLTNFAVKKTNKNRLKYPFTHILQFVK